MSSSHTAPASHIAGPAFAAHRPLLSPAATWIVLLLVGGVVFGALEAGLRRTLGGTPAPMLRVALFFVGYDVATGLLLVGAIAARLRAGRVALLPPRAAGEPLPLSILVAAYNEADCIAATVRALVAQAGVDREILLGDDGSTDGTHARAIEAFGLVHRGGCAWTGTAHSTDGRAVPIRLFRFAHAGKGATLNALATHARHDVLVTIDADTTPAPLALRRLAEAFLDEQVDSAAGVVTIRNGRDNWLTHHQFAEYLKNALVRIGWSALGALEQVPGAFAGARARAFHAAGGFPVDSLTEDYELTFRMVAVGVVAGRAPLVVTVPEAQVFTEGPRTFAGFVRQRTRWFAGFLSTLARFRRLIFARRAAGFGLVRLPLKIVEAVLPITAFASLLVLLHGGLSGHASLARASLLLFVVRWLWDLLVYALALRAAPLLGDAVATTRLAPRAPLAWLGTATEALTYVWLKHVATLRGYLWAARRVRTWEASRATLPSVDPGDPVGASRPAARWR